jgi:hypothetical protein
VSSDVLPHFEVGHSGELFPEIRAVLPGNAVGQGVLLPIEEAGSTAAAQAARRHADALPDAHARALMPVPTEEQPQGRMKDGPPCISCVHYQPIRRAEDNSSTFTGSCQHINRTVAANARFPCAFFDHYLKDSKAKPSPTRRAKNTRAQASAKLRKAFNTALAAELRSLSEPESEAPDTAKCCQQTGAEC